MPTMIKCPNCDANLIFFGLNSYRCLECKKEYRLEIIKSRLVEIEDILTQMKGGKNEDGSNTETN